MAFKNVATVAALAAVNFGDMSIYASGAFVPDGDYIMTFNVMQHQAKDKNNAPKGPIRLGVMVDFMPMDTPTPEMVVQQFYSFGSKAIESFAPNADTGKGVVPIPGAKGGSLSDKSNWMLLLKSMYDSGLPSGIFINDVSVLDGVWVHVTNVDEPAERATYGTGTAEVQQDRRINKIAIVTEIKEGGAPWEGGGGTETPEPAKPVIVKPIAKVTPKVTPKATPAPAPPVEVPADEDGALKEAASNGVTAVLSEKPNGMPRLALRTATFNAVKKASDEATASAVISAFFEPAMEGNLLMLIGELGYTLKGPQVVPATA